MQVAGKSMRHRYWSNGPHSHCLMYYCFTVREFWLIFQAGKTGSTNDIIDLFAHFVLHTRMSDHEQWKPSKGCWSCLSPRNKKFHYDLQQLIIYDIQNNWKLCQIRPNNILLDFCNWNTWELCGWVGGWMDGWMLLCIYVTMYVCYYSSKSTLLVENLVIPSNVVLGLSFSVVIFLINTSM